MKPRMLLSHIAERLGERRCVLVAFSGGLDSTVLLRALVALRETQWSDLRLRAIHIHHGLNPFAGTWDQHCQYWCQLWDVPLLTVQVQLSESKKGIEASAREARYQALSEQLQPGETLLTAQHLDDQCETFLLALKRGSGPAGLASMAERMPFSRGELLRPLLALSRQQLEEYAKAQGLSWVEDDSNQNDQFDRNFLRLRILPILKQRWPHFALMTARSASICAEQEQLLDELLAEQLNSLLNEQGALAIDGLLVLSEARRAALLRRWIATLGGEMPSREQLQRLWREVALSRDDAEPCLQYGHWQVRRFRQHLYLLPLMCSLQDIRLEWDGLSPLALPDNLGDLCLSTGGIPIRAPTTDELVSVRFSAYGQVRIVGRQHARAIKKVWQELNIPPWERTRTPLLYFNEQLITALGVFVTQEGQVTDEQDIWEVSWSSSSTGKNRFQS